jgi:hypothetical protein
MPMRHRALNLEGDCHVPYTRRLRLEARSLRGRPAAGASRKAPRSASGARKGTSSANPPGGLRGPAAKPLGSRAWLVISQARRPARSPAKRKEARCRNQAVTPLPNYRERCSARAGKHRRRSSGRSMTRYGPRGGRSSSSDRLHGAEAEFRETRRPLDCQGQSRRLRRGRESRSACCPHEEQRAADPAVAGAVGVVTRVLSRCRAPHVGTTPPGSGSALSKSPSAGVCARQPGKLGRYERRYCKPCVSTALRHSVPPTVASVALSAG